MQKKSANDSVKSEKATNKISTSSESEDSENSSDESDIPNINKDEKTAFDEKMRDKDNATFQFGKQIPNL